MATVKLHGHNYTVIRPHTKNAQRIIEMFNNSSDVELRDVYGSYSRAKENAYAYCRDREREFGSYNGVITGHNSMQFSYAFTGICEGQWYLIFITRWGDYAVKLDKKEA